MDVKRATTPGFGSNPMVQRLRALLPTVLIVAFFALLALVYFSPAVLEGRDLYQHDVAGASGTAQDVRDHYEATGEVSYWTNSLFGGMPMYQIAPTYPSLGIIKGLQDVLTLQKPFTLLPSYSWLLFAMLLGFYLFGRSLRLGRGLAVLGALMWCFSSYFIILIDAGHIWKLMVLSFIPPTIAGIVYTYEGQYLKGGIITAFFAALQLMSNHVQMSYYFAFVIVAILIAYLYDAIKRKQYKTFLVASATTLVAALVAIAVNGSNLYHTYEYSRETMRGGSALSKPTGQGATASGGLDKAYITAWSYGKAESLTFLVPNLYGGASGYLGQNEQAMARLPEGETKQMVAGMNHYWGDQPFTSGPVYVGAFVLFLAVLGLFVVRTPLKWALLGATVLSFLLAWGHNLMWFSDLFIDYFPLYNKFRTVSSILVIAEFTIPTLAVLALVEFLANPSRMVREERRALAISVALTLGVAFLLALVPGMFFDFVSGEERELFRQYLGDPRVSSMITTLKEVRSGIVSADALRSFVVILVGLGLCFAYYREWLSRRIFLLTLAGLVLADLWFVDRRYLGEEKFIAQSEIQARATPVSAVDELIKQDKDPHYRVLNLSVSPFNDATTSYSHRSIGGYHAAKLGRYQDVIERQIAEQNQQVLNMLDMRYVITRGEDKRLSYQRNEEAFGAAWLIAPERLHIVASADEEMDALRTIDLKREAVLNTSEGLKSKPHIKQVSDKVEAGDGESLSLTEDNLGAVKLVEYKPNRAIYDVDANREALLVMSEVYYPHGWQLTIDGKPAEIKRANYLLRAVMLPEGKHRVEMVFAPGSIQTSETLSWLAQSIWLGAVLLALGLYFKKNKQSIIS